MNKRRVSFSTVFSLLKGKRPFGYIGLLFLVMSTFVILPTVFNLSSNLQAPYEKYDQSAIAKNGVVKEAIVTSVNPLNNVTINGVHPLLISYDYIDNAKKVSDQFETMDKEATNLTSGSTIKIKAYNGESAIEGFVPFSFPVVMFYIIPVVFFFIGSILFLVAAVPAYRTYKLYSNGIVRDAKIFSMFVNGGSPVTNIGRSVLVNYYYFDVRSNKIFSTTSITDFSIMHEKRPEDTIKIFVSETDETKSCMVPPAVAIKNNWKI